MLMLSKSRKAFLGFNVVLLTLVSLLCVLPVVHILAVSLSASPAASAGSVGIWPIGFNIDSYRFVLAKPVFVHSFGVSLERVFLGLAVNLILTCLVAYPLSKDAASFRHRTLFAWYFVFTILFNGGLIPTYMTVRNFGILDSIWALVLPGAVPVFNVILLLNFFRGMPKELEESAFLDGAGHWRILGSIYLPLSLPGLATVALFTIVGHWNSWFDGIIYMSSPDRYPLASYLQTSLLQVDLNSLTTEKLKLLETVNDQTQKAAQIFISALPVLAAYPFLQRFFIKGLVMGSVKG
ncbi:carbohydrate ABC transporter permease [Cohnella sp. GCM10012308]|uniref:carbohydrate ABC transporter permease n=1 Tax=Cohnella sp. GCM10012308 TaxID=3317329 RepID=UPI003619A73B